MRHTYASPREKRRDLWLAFAGWFVVNAVLVVGIQALGSSGATAVALALSGALVLVNVAAPIVLAFIRPYVALGLVLAFATGLALTIVEGVFFTISDFAGAINNSSIGFGFLAVGFALFAIGAFFVLRAIHRGIK